jgi:hypothetical protein
MAWCRDASTSGAVRDMPQLPTRRRQSKQQSALSVSPTLQSPIRFLAALMR